MKYCHRCNKTFEDSYNLCPYCGSRLVDKNDYDGANNKDKMIHDYFSKREFSNFITTFVKTHNLICTYQNDYGLKLTMNRLFCYVGGNYSPIVSINNYPYSIHEIKESDLNDDMQMKICLLYLKSHMDYVGFEFGYEQCSISILDALFGDDSVYDRYINKGFTWPFPNIKNVPDTKRKLKDYCLELIVKEERRLRDINDILSGNINAYSLKNKLQQKLDEGKRYYIQFKNSYWGDNDYHREEIEKKVKAVYDHFINGIQYRGYKLINLNDISSNKDYKDNVRLFGKFDLELDKFVAYMDYASQSKKYRKSNNNLFLRDGFRFVCLRLDCFEYDSNKLY